MKTPHKLIIALFGISIISLFYLHFTSHSKIAFVDSTKLLANYEGMKQAQKAFQAKAVTWQANVDTLNKEFQESLTKHTESLEQMSKKEQELSTELLRTKQQQLRQYQQAIGQKAQEEEQKVTIAVLEEVNAYLKAFGHKNGYQIILAATDVGNIAYADDAIDITEDILKDLNQVYIGQ